LANAEALRPLVHAIEAVPLSVPRARLRALAALTGSRPLTCAFFDEAELRSRVRERVSSGKVDFAIVFSSGVAQFIEEFSDLPRVIQFADLDSQKWQLYSDWTHPPKRWIYAIESKRMLAYERRLATTFSQSLVCSPRECEDFGRLIPNAKVECLPNGVDLDYFKLMPGSEKLPNSLIFTGVMDYRPNVDGVNWFCHEVLPLIRTQVPDVNFTICGSSPDRSIRALARQQGVTVTGSVPDVRPHLAKANVAVIPLRFARGIQNKLLEAMAMGLPCVATTAAWAGIEAEDGRDLLVANDAPEFACSVVELLRDQRRCQQIGQAARDAVETRYTWNRTLSRLDELIEDVSDRSNCIATMA
jgi:sugar transferase (PEP-CTERM/EpsH1 system associated)